MVAPIRYLSRRQQEQKIGILQNTEEVKVLEVIGRVGIGTTIFDAEYNLDVRGTANVSGILSVGQIISGAGNTFSDLTVTGDTDLQSDVIIGGGLTVTGVSTFTSDVDINASVDISSNLTIAGVSTFQDTALFDDGTEAKPSISFINDTDLGLYRPVDNEIAFTNGGSESIRITSDGRVGIGTTQPFSKLSVFSTDVVTETRIESTDYAGYASILLKSGDIEGAFYASSSEDVIVLRNNSNTTGSALGLAGTRSSGADIAIFRETRNVLIGNNPLASSQTGTANQKLQVQSGAYISGDVGIGTTNPSQKLDVNGNVNISGELHGPELFIIDPAAVGDNTGAVRIKGDLYVDGTEFIVDSQNILLADYRVGIATTVATNVLLDGAGISIGDTNIEKTFTYNNTANTLESSIGLGVTEGGEFKTGTDSVLDRTTLGPTVVNSSLTNLGTLTELNVSGFSTFSNTVDINASAEIDTLNVSLLSNFSGDVDINASLDIQDNLTVTGLSSFFSNVDITGNLDVDGHTELDNVNVSGVSTFAGDISIADKIVHTGDTNTAIRFPAADTFTVETAGTERLRVKDNGRIAIGADGIASYLIDARTDENPSSGVIALFRNNQGNGTGSFLAVGSNLKGNYSMGMPNNTDAFTIVDELGNDGTERLRITSTGDVGIGTNSPQRKLHTLGTQSNTVRFENTSTNDAFIEYKGTTGTSYAGHTGNDFVIAPSSTEQVRITSSGDVGIGTDNPGFDFHLFRTGDTTLVIESDRPNTDENANPKLIFRQDGGVNASAIGMNFDSDGTGNDLFIANSISSGSIRFLTGSSNGYTNATERLRITSAGDVGIGTDNIVDQLTLGSSTNQLLGFETDNEPTIQSYNANLHINTAGNDVVFDGNGNVGIATTLPSQTLDVNGDVRFRDKIFDSTGDAGVANYVLASGGPGSPWTWKVVADVGAGNLDAIFVRQDGSDVGAGGTNTTLDFYENFSLTQPTAGIASVRLSDDINISGILTVGQLNVNDTAGISTVISYDAVDQQRELQNIVIDCGTY